MKKKSSNKKEKSTPINLALARKVVAVVNKGLTEGLGNPVPGHMCVEAAVCFALGQRHGDNPKCVDGDVRMYKIEINDSGHFDTDGQRASALRRIAVAQLGSSAMPKGKFLGELRKLWCEKYLGRMLTEADLTTTDRPTESAVIEFAVAAIGKVPMDSILTLIDRLIHTEHAIGIDLPDFQDGEEMARTIMWESDTKEAIAIGIEALRRCGSPGVKLMDRLIAEKVI